MTTSDPPRSVRDLAAQAWIEVRAPLDRQLSPLGLRAIEALAPASGEVIVDIGCGTGQSLLHLADRVGPTGRVIGVDIAPSVLEMARRRTGGHSNIHLVHQDASALDLKQDRIDGFFSRFGVMALPRPVETFARFRNALRPGGRFAFVCWRSLDQNEMDILPLRAASLERLADATPFGFADPAYIHATLDAAGLKDIVVEAHDQSVTCGDLEATVAVLLTVGPLGRILRENPELRADAEPRVRAVLSEKNRAENVTLNAATWIVSARA